MGAQATLQSSQDYFKIEVTFPHGITLQILFMLAMIFFNYMRIHGRNNAIF